MCRLLNHVFKWCPVLLIIAIVAWSYYAYVLELCFYSVENIIERVFYLLIHHVLFFMLVWSFWQAIFTEPGLVPEIFKLDPSEPKILEKGQVNDHQRLTLENLAKDLPIVCRNANGTIPYCSKCHHIKPDRAHHCSECGVCILKMDHHCPMVNNCISFTNYKYFILLLFYGLLYCLFIAATSFKYALEYFTDDIKISGILHIVFLFFTSIVITGWLILLLGYHCYFISKNSSTLEYMRPPIFPTGPDENGFNLGRRANFVQIFGENVGKWFLPVFSSLGDGIRFPQREELEIC